MNLKNFVINMFSGDSPVSSKRVFGGIGFLSFIVLVAKWHQYDLLTILLVTSASLLGLETLVGAFKSRTDREQPVIPPATEQKAEIPNQQINP